MDDMGAQLRLSLLGKVEMWLGEQPLPLTSLKARALLIYLAVTGEPHSRSALAALLWRDMPETAARANLRMTLTKLRKAAADHFIITRDKVEFDINSAHVLDVRQFEELLDGTGTGTAAAPDAEVRDASLAAAVNLYRAAFLDDFYVPDAPAFAEWTLLEQERLRQRMLNALMRLIDRAQERKQWRAGIRYARRMLAIDPWREEAHQNLMLLLAAAGQRSAALAQYETCRQVLAAELGVEPSATTAALYQQIRDGAILTVPSDSQLVAAALPGTSRSQDDTPLPPPHNLPAATTPFVGRVKELSQIGELLADPGCRLLTLTGPGGMGKTRLAQQAARMALNSPEHFANGIYFVPLAAVESASALVPAIADTVGYLFSGRLLARQQLLNYLQEKQILLLLDNFEQIVDGAEILVDILESAPDVKIIVTSREQLNLYEEWVLAIEGLAYPPDPVDNIDTLLQYSAVQLFQQRARRADLTFSLTDELDGVVEICRLMQGMPLGIEVAAAHVRALSCREIAVEIRQNFDFLETRTRNVPARHRSLRAVFDSSWSLLAPEQRETFAKLAVFQGGFRREAAAQVAGASLRMLSTLVNASLLQRLPNGRYEIHELLRQLAAVKVPHGDGVYELHATYYASLLAGHHKALDHGEAAAIQEVDQEIDNVFAAWQWAVNRHQPELIGLALAGLCSYLELRGRFQDAERLLAQALSQKTAAAGTLHARLLTWRGRFNYILGNNAEARAFLWQSVTFLRQQAPTRDLATALINLALTCTALGEYGDAEAHAKEGLALFQDLGSIDGQAAANNNLGFVQTKLGRFEEARAYLQTSLDLYTEVGNWRARRMPLNQLGNAEVAVGNYERAQALYSEGLTVARALNDPWTRASFLVNLCVLAKRQEQYEQAAEVGRQSLALFRELGEKRGVAVALKNLGDIALARREWDQAQQLYEEGLAIREAIGDRFGEAVGLCGLAALAQQQGKREQAWQHIARGFDLAAAIDSLSLQVYILPVAAALLQDQEDLAPAVSVARLARDHEAAEAVTRQQAERILEQLEDELPETTWTAVSGQAPMLTLADVRALIARNN